MSAEGLHASGRGGYDHEALVYAGPDEFLAGTAPFVSAAVAAAEPVLVALPAVRVTLLRDALDADVAAQARFVAMEDIGRNPATIIPAWRHFLQTRPADGRPVWGIGEPIWSARSAAELAECHLHEALLNEAFADSEAFTLLCPYDTMTLPMSTIEEARRTHPLLRQRGARSQSPDYAAVDVRNARFRAPLSDPPGDARVLLINGSDQDRDLRTRVGAHGDACGLSRARVEDLVLATNEIVTNAVRHGGGGGVLQFWTEGGRAVCQVRDKGALRDAMVGRVRPDITGLGGRGLWIANQVCDLVQIRSSDEGTVVRIYVGP